eukprot:TRINITY_DN7996_c0_g1_i1.p1 TRINITY_DN7996_c0_g1~~TRINITY_DN7996_c0_g1_i1.p1  ORF type:complete len:333 (-),score=54.05 TRINITY_DN7996_c0_g1_i1:13-1011(-)
MTGAAAFLLRNSLMGRLVARLSASDRQGGGLQEEVDIARLYGLLHFRKHKEWPYISAGKGQPPEKVLPKFSVQRASVNADLAAQIAELAQAMNHSLPEHALKMEKFVYTPSQENQSDPTAIRVQPGRESTFSGRTPFRLSVAPSSARAGATGLWLHNKVDVGTVICLYPGIAYLPMDRANLVGEEHNPHLWARYDGTILNAKAFLEKPLGDPRHGAALRSYVPTMIGLGRHINHPPAGTKPNVLQIAVDLPSGTFPASLRRFIPNMFYRTPGLFDLAVPPSVWMHTLAFIAVRPIFDEEIFVDYRLQNTAAAPEWYTPVDPDTVKRRWGSSE